MTLYGSGDNHFQEKLIFTLLGVAIAMGGTIFNFSHNALRSYLQIQRSLTVRTN